MKLPSRVLRIATLLGVLSTFIVLVVSVMTTQLPLQITQLEILLILSFMAGSIRRLILLAVNVLPILAFVRCISAGPEARVEFGPLIMFPFILIALVVTIGLALGVGTWMWTRYQSANNFILAHFSRRNRHCDEEEEGRDNHCLLNTAT